MEHFLRDREGKMIKASFRLGGFLAALLAMTFASAVFASDSQSASSDAGPSASSSFDFANGLYARQMYRPAISEYEKFMRDNPQSPELATARYRAADSYYFTKDYSKAVDYFQEFAKLFPKDERVPMALFRIGASQFYLRQFPQAVRVLSVLSREASDPNVRSGALFYIGRVYDAKEEHDKSLQTFETLLRTYPQSEFAAYAGLAIGDAYSNAGQADKAIEAYTAASTKPEPVEIAREARFKLAGVYFEQKDFARSTEHFGKLFDALKNGASNGTQAAALKEKALLGLFQCDAQTKNLSAALTRAQENKDLIAKSAEGPEMEYLLAYLLADNKDYDAALGRLESILANPKKSVELEENTILKKAQVLSLAGKKVTALSELQSLIDRGASNAARAYFDRAEILEALGEDPEAITSYKTLLERHPDSEAAKAALYQMALLQLKMKDSEAAKGNFARFIQIYPAEEAAERASLEIIQIDLDASRYAEAQTGAAEFIKSRAKSGYLDIAEYKLGTALTGLGNFKEASEVFKKLVEQFPSSKLYPETVYGAAVSLEKAGDFKSSYAFYERLIREMPEHALSKEAEAHLGSVYIQAGDLEKAAAHYENILLKRPAISVTPDAAFWLVQYFLDKGRYGPMRGILAVFPDRFKDQNFGHEIDFFLGESFMGDKDYVKAAESYSKAVTLNPQGTYAPYAYLGIGIASLAQNDLPGAEMNLSKALGFEDELKVGARARFEIAGIRLREGKVSEAAKAYMLVPVFYDDPQYSPWALYQAAQCFIKTDQPEEAQKALEELAAHYPENEWAKKSKDVPLGSPKNT